MNSLQPQQPNADAATDPRNFMIATKSLPATRSTPSTPGPLAGRDPRFDKVRGSYRRLESNLLEFARDLAEVREVFLRDKNANLVPGGSSKSHDATSRDAEGFKAAVARELGIHPATAYRYLAVVKAVESCDQIITAPTGEVIQLEGGEGYKVTEVAQAKARELREEITTGGVPMNRALPAVKGLFIPGGSRGGKAATDHDKNSMAAMAKLATSLPHYYDLPAKTRDYLDATFGELLERKVIPESWLVMMAKHAKGGRR